MFYGYVDYTIEPPDIAFYVGKGNKRRVRVVRRNKKHCCVAAKHGQRRVVEFMSMDERAVLEWEIARISELDTCSTYLGCNFTKGGDGTSGRSMSKMRASWTLERRQKLASANAERQWTQEARRKINRDRSPATPETCRKRGDGSREAWRRMTAEQRRKISEERKSRVVSAEVRAKISAANKGHSMTAETRMKLSGIHRLRYARIRLLRALSMRANRAPSRWVRV